VLGTVEDGSRRPRRYHKRGILDGGCARHSGSARSGRRDGHHGRTQGCFV